MTCVLVADDEPVVLMVARRVLEEAGYRVVAAPDPATALDLWRRERADLAITDIRMPPLRGVELVLELRTLRPAAPILVMTGGDHAELVDQLNAAGLGTTVAVLMKPFSPPALLKAVAAALGGSTALEPAPVP
jgi:CheY-like chemotaxis protein